MQYDENAEKYGYEGEMTPIELECNMGKDINGVEHREPWKAYDIDEVDALIAQKDFEIDRLKEFNAFLKHRVSNGDVGCSTLLDDLEQKDKENAELKAKLENVQASMYCDVVDANMEVRRLRRALWLARAEWARSSALSYHLIESHPDKDVAATYKRKANRWEKAKDKCLKKAEEYK